MPERERFRRRTAEGWKQTDPLLKRGEPGYETDTGKVKVGDGTSTWCDLPYVGDALISDLVERVHTLEEASGGGGGGGGGLQRLDVKLTQADILQMPVVPKVLIPATETGLNYRNASSIPVVFAATWAFKCGAVDYGNLHPTGKNPLILHWGSDFSLGFGFAEQAKCSYSTGIYSQQYANVRDILKWGPRIYNGQFDFMTEPNPPSMSDNAVGVTIMRDLGVSGPLTGGNATDWLKISLWYDIIDFT